MTGHYQHNDLPTELAKFHKAKQPQYTPDFCMWLNPLNQLPKPNCSGSDSHNSSLTESHIPRRSVHSNIAIIPSRLRRCRPCLRCFRHCLRRSIRRQLLRASSHRHRRIPNIARVKGNCRRGRGDGFSSECRDFHFGGQCACGQLGG
jgi:hypothetical protein